MERVPPRFLQLPHGYAPAGPRGDQQTLYPTFAHDITYGLVEVKVHVQTETGGGCDGSA